jgi:hypothetical protein
MDIASLTSMDNTLSFQATTTGEKRDLSHVEDASPAVRIKRKRRVYLDYNLLTAAAAACRQHVDAVK